ncbi:MAG TPA: hypothetical protein DHV28_17545 [Ignavibacteriales bacterium]|nr:hypothetical protein [Ignavibacteriales bacterium]
MKWFHIKFSSTDLFGNSDEKFINQFINLVHTLHSPEKLGLYSLKFHQDDGLTYFASCPVQFAGELKKVLSYYPAQEVSRPNLNLLNLEIGKNGVLGNQE